MYKTSTEGTFCYIFFYEGGIGGCPIPESRNFLGKIAIPSVPVVQNKSFPISRLKMLIPDSHLLLGKGTVPEVLKVFFPGKIPKLPGPPTLLLLIFGLL